MLITRNKPVLTCTSSRRDPVIYVQAIYIDKLPSHLQHNKLPSHLHLLHFLELLRIHVCHHLGEHHHDDQCHTHHDNHGIHKHG